MIGLVDHPASIVCICLREFAAVVPIALAVCCALWLVCVVALSVCPIEYVTSISFMYTDESIDFIHILHVSQAIGCRVAAGWVMCSQSETLTYAHTFMPRTHTSVIRHTTQHRPPPSHLVSLTCLQLPPPQS